jgi:hypothetical protein
MCELLAEGEGGMFRWPDQPWLPLAYSLRAERLLRAPGSG